MKKGLMVVLLLLMLFLYASFVEPNLLIVDKKTLIYDSGQGGLDNSHPPALKIAQFTDTQLGPFYSLEQFDKAVERINKEEPDIIIFTGDLFDVPREYEDKEEAFKILKKLDDRALKIAIFGNHDFGGGGKAIYEDFMAEAGFVVLVNEMLSYKTESGQSFDFFGIDDGMLGKPNFEFIESKIETTHYNILILHEPDLYEYTVDQPFDLVLSGHSHGGQISLPFIGPLVTPPLSKIYTNGYYDIDNERKSLLYVNTGLGNTKMRYRFGNIPKITVFMIEQH